MSIDAPIAAPAAGRRLGRGVLKPAQTAGLALLFAVPLVLVALKQTELPAGAWLRENLSLWSQHGMHRHLFHLLLVAVGALCAVFVRLTLGIRILGPFRSVLIAMAFLETGIPLGLTFLVLVTASVVWLQPRLRAIRLSMFGRVSVTLGMVTGLIVTAILAARGLHWEPLVRTAFFPIVALSLAADGFASARRREGMRSALWRGAMTALLAVGLTLLGTVHGFSRVLLHYPELLLLEIALMVSIAEWFGFRLLASWNPPVPKRKKKKRRKSRRKRLAAAEAAAAATPPPGVMELVPGIESTHGRSVS